MEVQTFEVVCPSEDVDCTYFVVSSSKPSEITIIYDRISYFSQVKHCWETSCPPVLVAWNWPIR